jgi:uncharacterized protein (TIGR04255 family)
MTDDLIPQLRNPPIVEAVIDFDCDLPPQFDLAALEGATRATFGDKYPKLRTQLQQEFLIETKPNEPSSASIRQGLQALQCLYEDDRQLVQVRTQGFSFNRLAPYSTLDDYLPEIERTWRLYIDLVEPVRIRVIRLRYINLIHVPLTDGRVDLDEFFMIGPRVPDEERLRLSGFLTQQAAVEKDTGSEVNLVLTAQAPEKNALPVILDITVASRVDVEPSDWTSITRIVASLRSLKNRVFRTSLTDRCIRLFQS